MLNLGLRGITERQISLGGALQESLESPVWEGGVSSWKEKGGERRSRGALPKCTEGREGSPVGKLRHPRSGSAEASAGPV